MAEDNDAPETKRQRLLAPPPFSGVSLEHVMGFGLPKDVAKSSMVCKTWKDDLTAPAIANDAVEQKPGVVNNSESIWKQAAMNAAPDIMWHVEHYIWRDKHYAIMETGKEPTPKYRRLAAFVSKKPKMEPSPLPETSFDMANLKIMVELSTDVETKDADGQSKTETFTLGAYSGCGDEFDCGLDDICLEGSFSEDAPLIEGRNYLSSNVLSQMTDENREAEWKDMAERWFQYHLHDVRNVDPAESWFWWNKTSTPIESAAIDALQHKKLHARVMLLRTDDWRSICLGERIPLEIVGEMSLSDSYDGAEDEHPEHWAIHFDRRLTFPIARNTEGAVLREIMAKKGLRDIGCGLKMDLEADVPPDGSLTEPKWLKEMRQNVHAEFNFSERDREEVSKVDSFRFACHKMLMWIDDLGRRETICLFEGLDWQ